MDANFPKEDDSLTQRVRMNIWMPRKLFAYIEHIASTEERTLTEVVRDAVRDKMQKDIRDGFLKDEHDAVIIK